MILSYPEFMRTDYFNRDYKNPAMSKDAPQRLKDQFEDYYNDPKTEDFPSYLRKTHPEIKNPYITWEGKVIDLTEYAKK